MKKNQLSGLLTSLGLSENESGVYLAALSAGPGTILKIARAAELKRTTVYSVVEALKQKGLMTIEVKGFKKLFVAEHPDKLERMVEERRTQLEKALPELSALYNLKGGESFIKYYEGLEAIKSVYEGLIRDVRPHDNYSIVSDQEKWFSLDPDFFLDFIERRAKLNINIRLLLTDTPSARAHQKIQKNFNEVIKILPPATELTTNLVVTPQKVVIHQLTPPLLAIVIENQSVIHMQQQFFEIMWKAVK